MLLLLLLFFGGEIISLDFKNDYNFVDVVLVENVVVVVVLILRTHTVVFTVHICHTQWLTLVATVCCARLSCFE